MLYEYLKQKPNSNNYKFEDLVNPHELYLEIKNNFYNKNNYNWSIKKCTKYVKESDLDPLEFIDSISAFFNYYFSIHSTKGKKRAFEHINKLKKSKNFKYCTYNFKGIELKCKNSDAVQNFLDDMKKVYPHLNMTQEDFIRFIFKSFNTGKAEGTLRRKYISGFK